MADRRPWSQLWRLLARLPRHSHYKAALDSDTEIAAMAYSLQDTAEHGGKPEVPLVDYDPIALRLDNLFDAINALAETVRGALSRKNQRVEPVRAPRPETALQQLHRQHTRNKLADLESQLTGGR